MRRSHPVAALALLTAPLGAQDSAPWVTAEEAAMQAQDAYGPADPRAKAECPPLESGEEIVVCGEALEDQEQFRVKSSGDLDPTGKGASGPPRAPDLYNLPQPGMVGVGVSMQGCFIPPCPPPMPRLIDLKAIPEAPPGSDADRVGKGLAPTGRDDRPAPPPGLPAANPVGDAVRPPE